MTKTFKHTPSDNNSMTCQKARQRATKAHRTHLRQMYQHDLTGTCDPAFHAPLPYKRESNFIFRNREDYDPTKPQQYAYHPHDFKENKCIIKNLKEKYYHNTRIIKYEFTHLNDLDKLYEVDEF